eukprot:1413709-Amphidinium_carterae.1
MQFDASPVAPLRSVACLMLFICSMRWPGVCVFYLALFMFFFYIIAMSSDLSSVKWDGPKHPGVQLSRPLSLWKISKKRYKLK